VLAPRRDCFSDCLALSRRSGRYSRNEPSIFPDLNLILFRPLLSELDCCSVIGAPNHITRTKILPFATCDGVKTVFWHFAPLPENVSKVRASAASVKRPDVAHSSHKNKGEDFKGGLPERLATDASAIC
jgi:hypothetical protein